MFSLSLNCSVAKSPSFFCDSSKFDDSVFGIFEFGIDSVCCSLGSLVSTCTSYLVFSSGMKGSVLIPSSSSSIVSISNVRACTSVPCRSCSCCSMLLSPCSKYCLSVSLIVSLPWLSFSGSLVMPTCSWVCIICSLCSVLDSVFKFWLFTSMILTFVSLCTSGLSILVFSDNLSLLVSVLPTWSLLVSKIRKEHLYCYGSFQKTSIPPP